ncbi:Metallo-dependent phosphatase-like protein [Mycena rebaudengoi]|nr:Metallo-dependent phosphatase-like protein [Mycena rebaudengoi]
MLFLPLFFLGASASPVSRSASSQLFGLNSDKKLTFDRNGNFKVVSFSDMHTGERPGDGTWAPWGPANDASTQRVHATILDQEKPNYVVFNGDLMTGENVFKHNATNYLDIVFAPTVARNIPFSTAHGNHDNANNINHQQVIEYEQAHYPELSHTRSDAGPKPYGSGNYWVPVYAKKSDWVPAALLWFFDSRSFVSGTGNGPGPIPDEANYYWVDPNSVPMYIKLQKLLMTVVWWKVPPSLVFVHIPVQKALYLYSLPSVGNHDDEPDPSVQGFLGSNYTGLDLPFWNALVGLAGNNGNVLAVTSGHDHGESWCARSTNSSGIPICFNGHSGYGGYVTTNSQVRNGRVFNLNLADLSAKHPTVKTWNSYENKTINDLVVLGPEYMKPFN